MQENVEILVIRIFHLIWKTSSVHGVLQARYWSGLPFPAPGDLPHPGVEPRSPALQGDSLPTELQGKPNLWKIPEKSPSFYYARRCRNSPNKNILFNLKNLFMRIFCLFHYIDNWYYENHMWKMSFWYIVLLAWITVRNVFWNGIQAHFPCIYHWWGNILKCNLVLVGYSLRKINQGGF